MKAKIGKSPEINPNPVLIVKKNGTVIYSNKVGKPLLHGWGIQIGGKLPLSIVNLMQRVISRNNSEEIKIKVGEGVYLMLFHPLPEQECVSISGFNISDHKKPGDEIQESEAQENENLELSRLIDVKAVQSLMNDFYRLANIPIALLDLKGNILVSVGWQEICTKFHRVNPETCKHCLESDVNLSIGVALGEYKLYRCKNRMWDSVTPIIVSGLHVGNAFSGQFFFDDEPLDYEFFRAQARKYGFNEDEYIKALEKVPRLGRQAVDTAMSFLTTFANMVSQLGYSNLKLAKSLMERDTLVEGLKKGEERFRSVLENSLDSAYRRDLQNNCFDYISPVIEQITGFSVQEFNAMSVDDLLAHIHPDDLSRVVAGITQSLDDGYGVQEYRFRCKNGRYLWLADHFSVIKNKTGTVCFRAGIVRDITKSKNAEETIRLSNIYNRSLIEASLDPLVTIAHDGKIMDLNDATEKVTGYFRNELIGTDFSCYFTEPEKASQGYQQVFIDGEIRDYPLEIRHKDGHITPVLYNASVYRDENGEVIGVFAAARDITELKRVEKELLESESRLRLAQTSAGAGIWDWNISTDKLEWSEELFQLFDLDSKKTDASFDLWRSILHPNDRLIIEKRIVAAINNHIPLASEYRIVLPSGEVRWINALGNTTYDRNGKPQRVSGICIDITDRKRTEEALKESEERLRLLGDNLPDSAIYQYVHEPDGSIRFLYFSTGIERLNGVSVQDVLHDPSTLYKQVPKAHFERLIEAETCSARELSDLDIELPMQLPDGQTRWMRLHSRPRRLPNGRIIWNGVQTDITERKKIEEALKITHDNLEKLVEERTIELEKAYRSLKESEKGLAEAQKMAHIGNWSWDFITDETCWSEEMYHIFGLNPQKLSPTHYEFLNYIHPDDRNYVDDSIKKAINERPFGIDYRIITANGKERKVHAESEVIFDPNNHPIRAKGIIQDITERKKAEEKLRESEEKYRNIVETANEIILITSNEEIITYANKKIADMLGYPPEEVIDRPIWGFISEENRPIVKMNLEKRRQGISESYEAKLKRKDGSSVWVLLNAKPLFDREGKYIGAMSMLTDITKRKEAEETLANIETARKKEIHHRIKNNLQVISSLLDLQAEQFRNREDIKVLEVLEAFRESKDRVISMALIHEELYKGEGFETLNFSLYIQELSENLLETYNLGDIEIALCMDLEENLFFDMDIAVPLGIIVNELVSNSLKHAFTGRNKGEIQIKLFREEPKEFENEECESTNFILKISDNGVGIPELNIDNLNSLGMQLVTSLVDQLEGKLELKRSKGTEFNIKFKATGKR